MAVPSQLLSHGQEAGGSGKARCHFTLLLLWPLAVSCSCSSLKCWRTDLQFVLIPQRRYSPYGIFPIFEPFLAKLPVDGDSILCKCIVCAHCISVMKLFVFKPADETLYVWYSDSFCYTNRARECCCQYEALSYKENIFFLENKGKEELIQLKVGKRLSTYSSITYHVELLFYDVWYSSVLALEKGYS